MRVRHAGVFERSGDGGRSSSAVPKGQEEGSGTPGPPRAAAPEGVGGRHPASIERVRSAPAVRPRWGWPPNCTAPRRSRRRRHVTRFSPRRHPRRLVSGHVGATAFAPHFDLISVLSPAFGYRTPWEPSPGRVRCRPSCHSRTSTHGVVITVFCTTILYDRLLYWITAETVRTLTLQRNQRERRRPTS